MEAITKKKGSGKGKKVVDDGEVSKRGTRKISTSPSKGGKSRGAGFTLSPSKKLVIGSPIKYLRKKKVTDNDLSHVKGHKVVGPVNRAHHEQ